MSKGRPVQRLPKRSPAKAGADVALIEREAAPRKDFEEFKAYAVVRNGGINMPLWSLRVLTIRNGVVIAMEDTNPDMRELVVARMHDYMEGRR